MSSQKTMNEGAQTHAFQRWLPGVLWLGYRPSVGLTPACQSLPTWPLATRQEPSVILTRSRNVKKTILLTYFAHMVHLDILRRSFNCSSTLIVRPFPAKSGRASHLNFSTNIVISNEFDHSLIERGFTQQ